MVSKKVWISALALLLAGCFLAFLTIRTPARRLATLRDEIQQSEATCLSLSNVVEKARSNRDWNTLQWYYAFKETETPDEEAWRLANVKVENELLALATELQHTAKRLVSLKAKLTAAAGGR